MIIIMHTHYTRLIHSETAIHVNDVKNSGQS